MMMDGACMAIIHASYTGTARPTSVSVRTVSTAHWSHIVANMNIHVLYMSRYVRYVRYVRYWTPRTGPHRGSQRT